LAPPRPPPPPPLPFCASDGDVTVAATSIAANADKQNGFMS
jgi:hypothetical protein